MSGNEVYDDPFEEWWSRQGYDWESVPRSAAAAAAAAKGAAKDAWNAAYALRSVEADEGEPYVATSLEQKVIRAVQERRDGS